MKKLVSLALLFCPCLALAATDAPSTSATIGAGVSKTGFSYFGYFSSEVQDVNAGNASIYSYNLIAINYKIDSRFTVSLRPTFTMESSGTRYGESSMPSRTRMADSNIALVDKTPFKLPYEMKSRAVYKIILPTDPEWQQAGTYGAVGADMEFTRDFAGFALGYYPKGYILAQRQSVFTYDDGNYVTVKPTQLARFEQWARFTKFFGDNFNVSQGIGLKDEFFNGKTAVQNEHSQYQLLETTLNFAVNDNVDISVGVGQETLMPYTSFQLFKDTETSYIVMTSIRM